MQNEVIAQTQGEMNQDACKDYRGLENEMNKTYQRILQEYKDDKVFIGKMKYAQKTWLAFRSAHVDAIYPAANKTTEYGSVYEMCHCNALSDMTKKRIEELKKWVSGGMEGDVCSGSVR